MVEEWILSAALVGVLILVSAVDMIAYQIMRSRVKKLEEHAHNVNKYMEATNKVLRIHQKVLEMDGK